MSLYLNTYLYLTLLGGRTARLYHRIRYLLTVFRVTAHRLPSSGINCAVGRIPPRSRGSVLQLGGSSGIDSQSVIGSSSGIFISGLRSGNVRMDGNHSGLGLFKPGPGSVMASLSSLRLSAKAYSSSNSSRNSSKGEAPIGVCQEDKASFQLSNLGASFGESFQHLSQHINVYFGGKRLEGEGSHKTADGRVIEIWEVRDQEPHLRMARGTQHYSGYRKGRLVKEEHGPLQVDSEAENQIPSKVQLFHISGLATKFGESYSYVASHINTLFSRGQSRGEQPPESDFSRVAGRSWRGARQRKHAGSESRIGRNTAETQPHGSVQSSGQDPVAGVDPLQDSEYRDSYYQYLAQYINQYFGSNEPAIKPIESARSIDVNHVETGNTAKPNVSAPVNLKREAVCKTAEQKSIQDHKAPASVPKTPGLFHISSLATSFGASYSQMANHVNCYFKGEGVWEEETEEEEGECTEEVLYESTAPPQVKKRTFLQYLTQPTGTVQDLLGSYLGMRPRSQVAQPSSGVTASGDGINRRVFGKRQAEVATRVLIQKIHTASGSHSMTARIEELNRHLTRHPECRAVAWQEKVLVLLLRQRRCHSDDQELQGAIREALALIGYADPVKGQGIRVLSIDGGGTRGLVALQVLKQLEEESGKPVHQMFDYVCGVSTGAVLAFTLGLGQISVGECEEMYRRFGSDVFRQNPLVGTVKMGWSHAYYNSATWEGILREKMGSEMLIKTARTPSCPKVAAVSAVVNWGTSPKPFIFRNYTHAPGSVSRYAGGTGHRLWQAVRASSAAPGYFQEFRLHNDIHQDGGLLLNNPCALAVHECRLLWPGSPFQCVVSLGTGRYDSGKKSAATSTSLRSKISNVISSATDTEGVHTLLDDLLPVDVYFRFNPLISAYVPLDESRAECLDQLRDDTELYLQRNRPKLQRLSGILRAERGALRTAGDWLRESTWLLRHRWS
ncbi:calcium-independent phospholipase A2-gamma-like isoform X1 [Acipenser ruthenus]|uniref:calcium-independent phospholipase A2-gamma-like isoform X1 n=2 Tax=Acipenser ruthenus TaxID=7906 RepID=UPI001561159A|nr:calcium-independent phospholipase A2-gamma-like isoform X1 [Acipenser ruthenus]XP_058860200.1 calcium-independent phospholipase A2-gamma-like isoform X1 [Acipenser ruthenus]